MEQLVGFVLGIIGSLLTWWIFARWLVPKVRFEDVILIRPSPDGSGVPRFMIKFYNDGRRDLIDVSITAILQIQTRKGSDKHWANCRLAFHRDGSIQHGIPLVPRGASRLVTLYPRYSQQLRFEQRFSAHCHAKFDAGTLDLRDVLIDGADRELEVRLRIFLFGFDSFSGARKLYPSKFYTRADLS